ncbi:glycosyltransferase family 2 protein [Ursidibacter arcticus]
MKFSIIIPAYNIADFITESVYGVLSQDYNDYELIIVNDGSTDNTRYICESLCKTNNCIKLINKQNGGLSSARNEGLKVAVGEYTIFLDGDDFWDNKSFLYDISLLIENSKVDIVLFPYSLFYSSERIINKTHNWNSCSCDFKADLDKLIKNGIWNVSAWNKCVKTSILRNFNIDFPVGRVSEDVLWCGKLLLNLSSYEIYNKNVYMYRQNREGSITYVVHDKNIKDILWSINELLVIIDNNVGYDLKEAVLGYCLNIYLDIIPYCFIYRKDKYINSELVELYDLTKRKYFISGKKRNLIYMFIKLFGLRLSLPVLNLLIRFYKKVI